MPVEWQTLFRPAIEPAASMQVNEIIGGQLFPEGFGWFQWPGDVMQCDCSFEQIRTVRA
jgi:hypothetical protein